jgi:hypothetical protein
MANNRQWAEAMSDRLMDGLSNEYDQRTKDLIVQSFLGGLASYPDLIEELKSSSLIESDYFDDDEQPDEERTIEGKSYKIRIKMAAKKH